MTEYLFWFFVFGIPMVGLSLILSWLDVVIDPFGDDFVFSRFRPQREGSSR